MRGFQLSENALNFSVVRLHYTADPEHDPGHQDEKVRDRAQRWLDLQRSLWPDPNDWSREMEINFFVAAGRRVFPQFTEETHGVITSPLHRRRVLYRGWDFGWHSPCCLIAQIDGKDRLIVLKEVVGSQQTTRDFAQSVIDKCAQWFPQHTAGFEDFCDPAGQQVQSIESEKSERRDIEVLNGLGIFPKYEHGWSRKDGRSLVHQLLRIRNDRTPSLYIDPAGCQVLVRAFLGGYCFPETKDGKIHEEPDDKIHPWSDVIAALRYLVTGLHGRLGLRRLSHLPKLPVEDAVDYHGYGLPVRQLDRAAHA